MTSDGQDDEPAMARALEFLRSFTDYEQKAPEVMRKAALGLDRMRRVAAELGDPHRRLRGVHVTGSKGKGTTTTYADAIFRAHGLRSGRFLSPHIERMNERIAIDGRDIDDRTFGALTDRLRPFVEARRGGDFELLPTFFESLTLMGFAAFAAVPVDVVAVEVGLGGRLDATNIFDGDVALVTSIDLEHTRILGYRKEDIALEKSGIIKPGRPAISGVDPSTPAGAVIAKVAAAQGSPLWVLDRDIRIDYRPGSAPNAYRIDVDTPLARFTDLLVPTLGEHQVRNAALAVAAAALLLDRLQRRVSTDAVRAALAGTRLPARLEIIDPADQRAPIGYRVLLDSAHTPGSMAALRGVLTTVFPNRRPSALVALLSDKDVRACLAPLEGAIETLYITSAPSPRSYRADELAARIADLGLGFKVEVLGSYEVALAALPGLPVDGLVVAGSTYLAGVLRRIILRQ